MSDETSTSNWSPPESDGDGSDSAPSLPGASAEDESPEDPPSSEPSPPEETSDSDSDDFELLSPEERSRRRTERRRQERRKDRIQDYNRSMNSVPGHNSGSPTPSSDRLTGDADDSDGSLNLFRQLDKLAHRRPKLYGTLIVGLLVALLLFVLL